MVAWVLGAARLVRGLVFDIAPTNPGVMVFAAAVLIASALAAAAPPARRAASVDPIIALRNE